MREAADTSGDRWTRSISDASPRQHGRRTGAAQGPGHVDRPTAAAVEVEVSHGQAAHQRPRVDPLSAETIQGLAGWQCEWCRCQSTSTASAPSTPWLDQKSRRAPADSGRTVAHRSLELSDDPSTGCDECAATHHARSLTTTAGASMGGGCGWLAAGFV